MQEEPARRLEDASRAPPFTWQTFLVSLGKLYAISPVAALGVYLGFRALLRTGELLPLESNCQWAKSL